MRLMIHDFVGADGVTHRLTRDAAHAWLLTRNGVPQYSFTEDEVWPCDLVQANHWTATAPASRFVQTLVVSRLSGEGLKSLKLRRLPADEDPRNGFDADALARQLAQDFNIRLDPEEFAALPVLAV